MPTGVDGARGGWLVVEWRASDVEVRCVDALASVLSTASRPIAVDVPIGLKGDGSGDRACDKAARRALPRGRKSSVFPPPRRDQLALRAWRAGLGLTRQAFHLLPRIRDADEALGSTHPLDVVESHPEVAFVRLAPEGVRAPKRMREGREQRAQALARVPGDPFAALRENAREALRARGLQGRAQPDDLLDACVLAWVAWLHARGGTEALGDGAVDARGRRMEIVTPRA